MYQRQLLLHIWKRHPRTHARTLSSAWKQRQRRWESCWFSSNYLIDAHISLTISNVFPTLAECHFSAVLTALLNQIWTWKQACVLSRDGKKGLDEATVSWLPSGYFTTRVHWGECFHKCLSQGSHVKAPSYGALERVSAENPLLV